MSAAITMALINHLSLGPHLWEHPYYENMVPVVVTSMILLSLYHTYYNNHISDHGYDQPLVFGTSSVGTFLL